MSFSSDSVEVFLAVIDHGSFSAAARALRRVPSAVSMAIAHLEAELDLQLFSLIHPQMCITTRLTTAPPTLAPTWPRYSRPRVAPG
ncbi:LysR family transcriptional regulator, partial [Variovorax paradoxus]|uniref:helix-turn-helix domain-containing protein n=1 Tax=Variovorax paradoxus TaxID=34073 RepID=UPI0024784369